MQCYWGMPPSAEKNVSPVLGFQVLELLGHLNWKLLHIGLQKGPVQHLLTVTRGLSNQKERPIERLDVEKPHQYFQSYKSVLLYLTSAWKIIYCIIVSTKLRREQKCFCLFIWAYCQHIKLETCSAFQEHDPQHIRPFWLYLSWIECVNTSSTRKNEEGFGTLALM